jgi:mannosyl-3-phosphoglycerate phosphatase family protein
MHQKKLLVFTDLDGTVLDHYSYSHALAEPMLRVFMRENIPVIPVSSKTRAELEPLRVALENHHPFIVENGAGICIPENYFPDLPSGYEFINGYWQKGFSRPRAFWQACLRKLQPEFESDFISFSMAGTQGIAKMTGLSLEEAEQANQRQYSEPLLWRGSPERRNYFLRCLQDMDVRAVQGGRFLHLIDECDKGRSMQFLAELYRHNYSEEIIEVIAAGDGENDVAMLEVADQALIVRSPAHELPRLKRTRGVYISESCGPAGWAEGIQHLTGYRV